MSDHPPHGATKIHATKQGGGGGKWLLGAVAVAVIAGGGYYAYTTLAPAPAPSEFAAVDGTYADDPLYASPAEPGDDIAAESASADAAPDAAAPARSTTSRRAATAPAPARAETVPEATIGVTPVSLSTSEQGEDIVVTAPARPVWASVPSERRLSHMYPDRALQQGLEGEASLHCMVQEGGALDCTRVSESRSGFGNAALRVSRSLRHAAQTADGRDAIGTPVNLRVVFRMDDDRRG